MPRKQRNDGLLNKHQLKTQRLRAKRVTTITDLLTRDDVNDILAEVNKSKDKIKNMVVITVDHEDNQHWWITDETLNSIAVFMLESTKFDLMNEDCGE
jgi:hypothetical protein